MTYTLEPSGPPAQIEVEALSSSSISVSWQPPDIYEWNGVVRDYVALIEQPLDEMSLEYKFNHNECWLDCVIDGKFMTNL